MPGAREIWRRLRVTVNTRALTVIRRHRRVDLPMFYKEARLTSGAVSRPRRRLYLAWAIGQPPAAMLRHRVGVSRPSSLSHFYHGYRVAISQDGDCLGAPNATLSSSRGGGGCIDALPMTALMIYRRFSAMRAKMTAPPPRRHGTIV